MIGRRIKRIQRHNRVRGRISGKKDCPRLCVFRSASHIYAQLIDDDIQKTLVSASDVEIKKDKEEKGKIGIAFKTGELIAEKAKEKKITKVVFDRGGYKYHGRVKALAEGARKGGLKF
ncbi:50S ribosomal protein L18 [Patescibacteria group bacterium]|nr:50S ribosomal protein L18 [Patescibacteria group bacterium]MBU4162451.1 50S ribosomal protein L18 [Patescibacteria group bacterium]